MKNSMQLKAFVKNIANKNNISAQAVLQNYLLERLLEKISLSQYKSNFILKGGMLIADMVGINSRTTMDMDTTIKKYPVTKDSINTIIETIINISIDDNIIYEISSISEIRKEDDYDGFRVSLKAIFDTLNVPLKLDISTGDIITPNEIKYTYNLMFENRNIEIFAYNLETILAEKFETIIRRSTLNTRMRDFYDVYILVKLKGNEIDAENLKIAINQTAQNRETIEELNFTNEIIQDILENEKIKNMWKTYQNDYNYASEIAFDDVIEAVRVIGRIQENKFN